MRAPHQRTESGRRRTIADSTTDSITHGAEDLGSSAWLASGSLRQERGESVRQTLGRHVDLPRELLGTTDVKVSLVEELTREELADGVVFRAGEAEGREFLPTFPKQGLRVGVVAAELIGSCEPEDVDVNLGARDLAQDSDMVVVVGPTCADSSLGPAQREVGGHQSWQPPALRTSAESSSLDLEEGKEVLGLAVELLGNERDLEDSRKQECRQDPNGGAVAVINAIQLLASEAAGLGEARVD